LTKGKNKSGTNYYYCFLIQLESWSVVLNRLRATAVGVIKYL